MGAVSYEQTRLAPATKRALVVIMILSQGNEIEYWAMCVVWVPVFSVMTMEWSRFKNQSIRSRACNRVFRMKLGWQSQISTMERAKGT